MKRTRVERGLYRQANGNFGIYVLADGRHHWKTVGNKLQEARRQRDLLCAKAHRGELAAPSRLTFAELAETWISGFEALVESGERAERTLENYRYYLDGYLLPAFGKKRLPEISTDDLSLIHI